MKKNMKTKRLVADISIELHNDIKTQASYRGVTIHRYIMEAILERLLKDKKVQ